MTSTELAKLSFEEMRVKARSDMNSMFLEYCQLPEAEFQALIRYAQISSSHFLALLGHNSMLQDPNNPNLQDIFNKLCTQIKAELSYIDDIYTKGETATVQEVLDAKRKNESSSH